MFTNPVQSRQQVIEHLRSNRQRTDAQKVEIQQRRNVLTRRIKVWRVAQAVYMPQAAAYLPNESEPSTSDDPQKLNTSKPETWPLLLPSAIPKDNRSLCYRGVIETERTIRSAQLQDCLVDLRRFRRALRNLRLYFKTNMAGEGQKSQTRSRAIETSTKNRIKRAVWRYRVAYNALLELDPTGDWTKEYLELRDEDNRGPLKEAEETGTGDGRYEPSWIWGAPLAVALPGEGSAAEQREVNETARHEWMTCRARADRWVEEEELLQEEMRRVIIYLEWKSRMWSEKVGAREGSCALGIQHGVDAYARKQAHIYHQISISFAHQWLPYLNVCGYETKWVADLQWAPQVVSCETKLPKWFPTVPPNPSPKPPVVAPPDDLRKRPAAVPLVAVPQPSGSVEGLGPVREYAHAHTERGVDSNYREYQRGQHPTGSNEDPEDEGDSDEDEDDEGDFYDDGHDELGFEYDDEYMT